MKIYRVIQTTRIESEYNESERIIETTVGLFSNLEAAMECSYYWSEEVRKPNASVCIEEEEEIPVQASFVRPL